MPFWRRWLGLAPVTDSSKAQEQKLVAQPTTRRQKTYLAESGNVYRYYFLGLRKSVETGESSTDYLFEVLAEDAVSRQVTVALKTRYVLDWESRNCQDLSSSEQYGIAKMCLFDHFEALENQPHGSEVYVAGLDVIDRAIRHLGIS